MKDKSCSSRADELHTPSPEAMIWLRKSDSEGIHSQLWQHLKTYGSYFVELELKSSFFKDVFEHEIF